MNTYPTTAEQIYMEQKMRDDNNPYNYERKKIAEAGQKRTLRDHTYNQRMKQLINIVSQYL